MGKLVLIPIAIILIFTSPYILWKAESQDRAEDFESAEEVDADSNKEGYILVKGTPEPEESLACPKDSNKSCIYVSSQLEEYTRTEEDVCTDTRPNDTILKNLEPKCDENNNCTPCYRIEKFAWERKESESESIAFQIGNYEVPSLTKANIQGEESYTEYLNSSDRIISPQDTNTENDTDDLERNYLGDYDSESEGDPYYDYYVVPLETGSEGKKDNDKYNPEAGDQRVLYDYVQADEELLIVGTAKDGEIFKDDKEFVVSTLSYSETLDNLKSQDNANQWGLRIASFIMMAGGFMMLFAGIAAIPLALVNIIPWIGDDISKFVGGVISFLAGVMGALLWIVIFLIISVLKSTIGLIVSIGLIALIGFWIWSRSQKRKIAPIAPAQVTAPSTT